MEAVRILTILMCCQRVLGSSLFATAPKPYIPSADMEVIYSSSQIFTIQEDISRPGILLAIQGYALVEISEHKTINVKAGSVKKKGNQVGNFTETRFGVIYSFLQRKEDNSVLLVDQDNSCIRSVNITSETTSVFSGLCGTKDQTHDGTLVEARYWNPYDIASIPNSSRILLTERDKVRVIDTDTGRVDTVHSGSAYFRRIAVTKDGSAVFITTSGDGIYKFDSSVNFTTQFDPECWTSPIDDWLLPQAGRKRRDFNFNNWGSPSSDTSYDYDLGGYFNVDDKPKTQSMGFKTLSTLAGIVLITDKLALVSTGNELIDNGLYLIDLVEHDATKLCVSSSDNFKLVQCMYGNRGRDLLIANSTLFVVGEPTMYGDYSQSLEYITLNDQCEVNGSSVYPLSTGISLENGTTVVCDIDTETSDVRWISSSKANSTAVNSSASNITDYESEQKEQDKPEVTVSLTTTTADITTEYNKTPQSTPATQDDNGAPVIEITLVVIVVLIILVVGISILRAFKNKTPASLETPVQEDFQSETYETIDQLDYHLYDEINNHHPHNVLPSSDQSGIQIRPLPEPLQEHIYADHIVENEGEYVIDPEIVESDTQPEPQYVINPQFIYVTKL